MADRAPGLLDASEATPPACSGGGFRAREARFAAAATGFFTLAAQAALLREFLVLFRGSELALGAFYGAWFLSVAAAAAAARRWERVRVGVARQARGLLALYPVGAMAGLGLLAGARLLAGVPPWAPVPPGIVVAGGMLAALPIGAITGVLFPALCDAVEADLRVGAASGYAWEAAGAVIGGLAATGAFLAGADGPTAVAAAGLVPVVAAWPRGARVSRRSRAAAAVPFVVCLAVLVPPTGPFLRDALSDLRLRANLAGAERLDETSTPYGLVTTARTPSGTVVLADGAVVLAVPPGPDVAVEAALLAVQPARRDRALLLGTGRFGVAVALARTFRDVEVVGADGAALAALSSAWEASAGPLPANLVRIVGDPRGRVRRAAADGTRFDLVVVAFGEPRTLADNRVHTVESYGEIREALAPGGVVAAPFRSGENVLGPEVLRFGRSMRATLGAVFGDVQALAGDEALLLAAAGAGQVTIDRAVLERRAAAIAATSGVPAVTVAERARPDRAEWLRGLLSAPDDAGDLVNRDDRPVAPFLSLLATLRRTGTGGLRWFWGAREAGTALPAGLLVLLLLLAVRERLRAGDAPGAVAAPVMMACAGGASIAASVVLLAAWRARLGALYGEVGLASAAVMVGLFLGAAAGRLETHRTARIGAPGFCLAAAAALAAMPWALGAVADASPWAARAILLGLLALVGGMAGAAWPIAAMLGRAGRPSQGLQAADHAGAAVGSVLSGIGGLAILGVDDTLRVIAGALAVAFGVVVLDGLLATGPGRRFLASRPGRVLGGRTVPWPAVGIVGAALLAGATWTWHVSRPPDAGPRMRLTGEELRAFEPAEAAEWREVPFGHHRLSGVREPAGEAVVLATGATGPGVPGYGGSVDLALSVGTDGVVRRVEVLAHRETPAYVKDLPAFVARFRGMDLRDLAARGDASLDAMTGATVTSRAVAGTIGNAARRVGGEILGLAVPGPAQAPPWHAPLADLRLWYAVLALAGAVAVHRWGSARVRLAFLLASAGIGGALLQVQLSAGWVMSWLRLEPPSLAATPAVAVLGAGVLVLAALWGPIYCAHVCPFGAVQEGVSLVGGRLGWTVSLSVRVHAAFRTVKYGVLVAVALAMFLPDPEARLSWDPLAAAFSGRLEGVAAALVVLSLAGSLFTVRFWCRGFCPVGAFLNLSNRVAVVVGILPERRYGACDLGVRGPGDGDCLQCNRCVRGTGLDRAPASGEEAP